MANQKLNYFKITVGGTDRSTALYANGNQQCRVAIDILKQSYSNNTWTKTDLNQKEIDSLTVMEYSDQLYPNPPLPAGWFCDRDKNVYTEGLRGSAYVAMVEPSDAELAVQASTTNEVPQTFYRYMRADRTGNRKFMACVTLEIDGVDKKYSTHFNTAGQSFESSITIEPQPVYTLRVDELKEHKENPYNCNDKGETCHVYTYYWDLPNGLWIISQSLSGGYEDAAKVIRIFCSHDVRMGAAVKPGVTSLTIGELDPKCPSRFYNQQITLLNSNSMLRGVWYESGDSNEGRTENREVYWSITDNYGCASRFILRAKDGTDQREMVLLNG